MFIVQWKFLLFFSYYYYDYYYAVCCNNTTWFYTVSYSCYIYAYIFIDLFILVLIQQIHKWTLLICQALRRCFALVLLSVLPPTPWLTDISVIPNVLENWKNLLCICLTSLPTGSSYILRFPPCKPYRGFWWHFPILVKLFTSTSDPLSHLMKMWHLWPETWIDFLNFLWTWLLLNIHTVGFVFKHWAHSACSGSRDCLSTLFQKRVDVTCPSSICPCSSCLRSGPPSLAAMNARSFKCSPKFFLNPL